MSYGRPEKRVENCKRKEKINSNLNKKCVLRKPKKREKKKKKKKKSLGGRHGKT